MSKFEELFARASGQGCKPHAWQLALAAADEPRSRLIRIPTGMGKTLGVLCAWAWHRLERGDDRWPRRLVWCLPMRVLVEQTEDVVRGALERLGVLWDGRTDHAGKVGVHTLMGGVDAGNDWNLYPEECAVLVGTQDMLLSRALNRGYAAGRARWPLELGLLSHDALWVMDEVQLMDVGLATSGQLQAFHDEDAPRALRPRHTFWMSATLQPRWLESVDTQPRLASWFREPCEVEPSQLREGLGAITKALSLAEVPLRDAPGLARLVLDRHRTVPDQGYGRVSLVVCNTVERASATFDALRQLAPSQPVEVVHSRFRPAERAAWRERLLHRGACAAGADRIIVATQVVEAGVDISAGCVISELAPWPSLVQRFGRCARYGGSGTAVVVDRGRDPGAAAPYSHDELEGASGALTALVSGTADVSIASLEAFERGLGDEQRAKLYPYEPRHLLIRRELDELFDTTPDLSGADLDISRFVRSGDERDLLVFWEDVASARRGELPPSPLRRRRPARDELCPVPFLAARNWLCGEETQTNRKPRLRSGMRAWVWDYIDGAWVVAERALLTPGRIVCVASECGGYRSDRGFDPSSTDPVPAAPSSVKPADTSAQVLADESEDADDLSASAWKTIACHGGEAAETAQRIATALRLPAELTRIFTLAGLWHDLGKAHPAFQGAIRSPERPARQDLAKAPDHAWPRPPETYRTSDDRDVRPGLRHELASALALFAVVARHQPEHPALLGPWSEVLRLTGEHVATAHAGAPPTPCEQAILDCSADEFDLLAYLVAAHHGKVRVSLHAGPRDQDYRDRDGRGLPIRGVREGDELPSVLLDAKAPPLPALRLTLEPASLGLSPRIGRSWRDRTHALRARFGPGALAWLEAVLIAADRRASRLTTSDALLASPQEPR